MVRPTTLRSSTLAAPAAQRFVIGLSAPTRHSTTFWPAQLQQLSPASHDTLRSTINASSLAPCTGSHTTTGFRASICSSYYTHRCCLVRQSVSSARTQPSPQSKRSGVIRDISGHKVQHLSSLRLQYATVRQRQSLPSWHLFSSKPMATAMAQQ